MQRLFVVLVLAFSFGALAADHPMDPLTAEEIETAAGIVKTSRKVDKAVRFPIIRLEEMPKADVLAWKPGQPVPRQAEVSVMQPNGILRAVVDLDKRQIVGWRELSGQAAFQVSEFIQIAGLVQSNRQWRAAMEKRGIRDFSKVMNIPFTAGYYGAESDKDKRLFRVGSYLGGEERNYWGYPIEGVIAVVDLNAKKVVEVIDTGVVPIPDGSAEYQESAVGPLRDAPNTVTFDQPDGASYTINGHLVSWQNWRFHYRLDAQAGLVISNVTYNDRGRERPVLYQGHLSELYVPYMDPGEPWYFKTFFDAGENNVGLMTSPLVRGRDCPLNATLLNAVLSNTTGRPQQFTNAVAIFERYAGDPAWRHDDQVYRDIQSRRAQDLVVRHIATIGNYDYIFDFEFNQSGAMKIRVGATGIDSAKAVKSRTALDDTTGEDARYGRFVGPNTVAVNHDHFLVFRLDFDVDGVENSFVKDELKKARFGAETPRTSAWVVDSQVAQRESQAKLNMMMMEPAMWRVMNPSKTNAWGHPVSYHIAPGHNAISLLDPDDWPQKRGAFSYYNLHVTPYRSDERFAAGEFPNQNDGADGLAAWTAQDREIANTDIVAWYSVGFHHVVRAEDWPVMPTSWHEVTLRPFDFFERNPALDLPGRE